ncbi:COMM domain-containing protein 6 [Manis javanica]|nr:COMM domain-containing protein 6 [Manis javanica]
MAVGSDSCRSLKYPHGAVLLKGANHSGQIKNKSFEMTILQFQVCNLIHSVLVHCSVTAA